MGVEEIQYWMKNEPRILEDFDQAIEQLGKFLEKQYRLVSTSRYKGLNKVRLRRNLFIREKRKLLERLGEVEFFESDKKIQLNSGISGNFPRTDLGISIDEIPFAEDFVQSGKGYSTDVRATDERTALQHMDADERRKRDNLRFESYLTRL